MRQTRYDGRYDTDWLNIEFPESRHALGDYDLEEIWYGGCRLRQRYDKGLLRPGSTLSGATMMALGDFAVYLAVLSAIGWVPLAVTTNLTINFLRKPPARDLIAEARLLKLGKKLAVGEVAIHADGVEDMVAHVTIHLFNPSGKIIPYDEIIDTMRYSPDC